MSVHFPKLDEYALEPDLVSEPSHYRGKDTQRTKLPRIHHASQHYRRPSKQSQDKSRNSPSKTHEGTDTASQSLTHFYKRWDDMRFFPQEEVAIETFRNPNRKSLHRKSIGHSDSDIAVLTPTRLPDIVDDSRELSDSIDNVSEEISPEIPSELQSSDSCAVKTEHSGNGVTSPTIYSNRSTPPTNVCSNQKTVPPTPVPGGVVYYKAPPRRTMYDVVLELSPQAASYSGMKGVVQRQRLIHRAKVKGYIRRIALVDIHS